MKRQIIGLFVNLLTADDMYSLLKRGYLLQSSQMPLSQKVKIFSQFFFTFSKFEFNFEHFQKMMKRDFLDIQLTTFFGVRQFKIPSTIKIILFLKIFEIESKYRKGK